MAIRFRMSQRCWFVSKVTIEIIDDLSLNASATSRADGYVIRINRGALQHAFGAALGLCCCPGFLPNVGNATDEVEPELGAHGFPPIPLMDQDDDSVVLVPRDQVRGTAAHCLPMGGNEALAL